ncbi:hypothetical protein SCARD494_00977 [Seiridium cardinale]
MHLLPTEYRPAGHVRFIPVTQDDSDRNEPSDRVAQRRENLAGRDEFRSYVRNLCRNAASGAEDEEDSGLHPAYTNAANAAYAPVGTLITNDDSEETDIAELAGPPIEFYAPGYARAPSALSKLSDTRTDTTYLGFDPEDKYLSYVPRVDSVELEEDPGEQPSGDNNYRPFVLRRTFLLILLLAVAVLLVLMAVAIRILPDQDQSFMKGLVSRDLSNIKSRSLGIALHSPRFPRDLNHHQNDTSGASSTISSVSDVRDVSSSTLSTTSTPTTVPDKPSPSEVKSDASSTSTTSTTTTTSSTSQSSSISSTLVAGGTSTTLQHTEPAKPSKGDDPPPSTVFSETVVSSTSTSTTTTNSPDKGQPTHVDPLPSENNPQPTDDDHHSGGDTTQTGGGNPQPTSQISTSPSTISSTSTSKPPDSTNGDPEPTNPPGHTGRPGTPTTPTSTLTTSTSLISNSEGIGSSSSSLITSIGDNVPPPVTTDPPKGTCTVDITQTHIQWLTIPVMTVDLGLGLKKRSENPVVSKIRRQAPVCDTTVTLTHDITVISTTAATTITIGIGGGQTGTTASSMAGSPGGPIQTGATPTETDTSSTLVIPSSTASSQPPSDVPTPPVDTATLPTNLPGEHVSSTTTLQETHIQPGGPISVPTIVASTTGSTLIDTNPPSSIPTEGTTTTAGTTTVVDTDPTGSTPTEGTTTTTAGTTTVIDTNPPSSIPTEGTTTTAGTTTVVDTNLPGSSPTDGVTVPSTRPTLTDTNLPGSPITEPITVTDATRPTLTDTGSTSSSVTGVPPSSIPVPGTAIATNTGHSTAANTISSVVTKPSTLADSPTQAAPLTEHDDTTMLNTQIPPTSNSRVSQAGHPGSGVTNQVSHTEDRTASETPIPPPTPTPSTTVVNVIESTAIVSTIISTVTPVVTPSADATNTEVVVDLGAVFITTVSISTMMYVTRLRTQQVIHGVMTDSSDGVQQLWLSYLTDSAGVTTSTSTQTKLGFLSTATLTNSDGFPTATTVQVIMKDPSTTTITDADGKVHVKTYYEKFVTTTLRDSKGFATATQTLEITETPTVTTSYDSNGNAITTVTNVVPDGTSTLTSTLVITATNKPNASLAQQHEIVPTSSSGYFTGLLLPTLLAIILWVPVRILDQTVKLHQPFSAMTARYGARTQDSLCLTTTGLWGLISGLRSPRTGNWLLAVTGLLVLANAVLIALSPEALQLAVLPSECTTLNDGNLYSCPTSLNIASSPARVVVGLICLMATLIGIAAWVLWRYRTGIWNDTPWSIFDISRLAKNDDITVFLSNLDWRHSRISREQAIKAFGNRRFMLSYWKHKTVWEYGVMVCNDAGGFGSKRKKRCRTRGRQMPFFTLSLAGRALFFSLLLGLLLMILLYNNTGGAFQTFMDNNNFGGRFILTGAGVIVSLVWWTFFTCIAFLSPYRLIYLRRSVEDIVHLSPPSNPFSGFWKVISRQNKDIYLGAVAFTAILSDLLPLLLANIPARSTGRDNLSSVCVWLTVSVICIMIMVVIWSFFIHWPDLPMNPSTIAGAMFYARQFSSMNRMSTSTIGEKSNLV